MNLRGSWALVRSTWTSWMQYRGFFFVLAFGWMLPPLAAYFVWAASAGSQQMGGYTRAAFAGYYLVLILVNQFTYAQANWTLGDVIRGGQLNFWLIRPLPALMNVLSAEAAGKTVTLAFAVPAVALCALVLQPELTPSGPQAAWFTASLLMAWALRFLWGCALAMLAFWSTRADALLALQDALIFILAGVVAPISLLPDWLQTTARFLPFRYMVGFPVEILTAPLNPAELIGGFAIQTGWLLVAAAATTLLWQRGLKRYYAIGG